jgi:hypothetical protein
MNIEEILISKHFVLTPTPKWIAINDPRPAFEKTFGKRRRFGKLQANCLYVTLDPLQEECERVIVANGFSLRHVRSSDGSGRTYPGFDTAGVSEAALTQLVDALCTVVDRHL